MEKIGGQFTGAGSGVETVRSQEQQELPVEVFRSYKITLPEQGLEDASIRICHIETRQDGSQFVWYSGKDHRLDFIDAKLLDQATITPTETDTVYESNLHGWYLADGHILSEVVIPQKEDYRKKKYDVDRGRLRALFTALDSLHPELRTPLKATTEAKEPVMIDDPEGDAVEVSLTSPTEKSINYEGSPEIIFLEKLFQSGLMRARSEGQPRLKKLQEAMPDIARAAILLEKVYERREQLVADDFQDRINSLKVTGPKYEHKMRKIVMRLALSLGHNALSNPNLFYQLAVDEDLRMQLLGSNTPLSSQSLQKPITTERAKQAIANTPNLTTPVKNELERWQKEKSLSGLMNSRGTLQDMINALTTQRLGARVFRQSTALRQYTNARPHLKESSMVPNLDHPVLGQTQVIIMDDLHTDIKVGRNTMKTHFNPRSTDSLVGSPGFPIQTRIRTYVARAEGTEKEKGAPFHTYKIEILSPSQDISLNSLYEFLLSYKPLAPLMQRLEKEGGLYRSGDHYIGITITKPSKKMKGKRHGGNNLITNDSEVLKDCEQIEVGRILTALGLIHEDTYPEPYRSIYIEHMQKGTFGGEI